MTALPRCCTVRPERLPRAGPAAKDIAGSGEFRETWSGSVDEECRGPGTLVVLATYNERLNIDRLLDPILALPNRCDVLVVDDNSPDGTGAHVQGRAAAEPRIKLVSSAE